jgi:hypothetical protein
VNAMPVASVKAKARIAALSMAITPLQGCLELLEALSSLSPALLARRFARMLQAQEKNCSLRHNRDLGRNKIIPGLTRTDPSFGLADD